MRRAWQYGVLEIPNCQSTKNRNASLHVHV